MALCKQLLICAVNWFWKLTAIEARCWFPSWCFRGFRAATVGKSVRLIVAQDTGGLARCRGTHIYRRFGLRERALVARMSSSHLETENWTVHCVWALVSKCTTTCLSVARQSVQSPQTGTTVPGRSANDRLSHMSKYTLRW